MLLLQQHLVVPPGTCLQLWVNNQKRTESSLKKLTLRGPGQSWEIGGSKGAVNGAQVAVLLGQVT